MKALTDKIIGKLENLIGDNKTSEFSKGLQQANIQIELEESQANFEEIARVMMKYLGKNHDPHVTVIITTTSAKLTEGVKYTGKIMDYIQD